MATYGKWIAKIARQKYRLSRGATYISLINTMLLLSIAFKISNPLLIILVGAVTLICVWLIGMLDDRLKLVHAESDHSVEATTPYFQTIRTELEEILTILKKRNNTEDS